jgi:hypothetical protein
MFHVKDGLWVEKRICADCPGYSWQEQIDNFYDILVYVTQVNKQTVINENATRKNDIIQEEIRQKIIYTTRFNVTQLASIMATLSVRGETTETYQEALDFLKKDLTRE